MGLHSKLLTCISAFLVYGWEILSADFLTYICVRKNRFYPGPIWTEEIRSFRNSTAHVKRRCPPKCTFKQPFCSTWNFVSLPPSTVERARRTLASHSSSCSTYDDDDEQPYCECLTPALHEPVRPPLRGCRCLSCRSLARRLPRSRPRCRAKTSTSARCGVVTALPRGSRPSNPPILFIKWRRNWRAFCFARCRSVFSCGGSVRFK